MLGRIVAFTAGSHSLVRYSLTDALVAPRRSAARRRRGACSSPPGTLCGSRSRPWSRGGALRSHAGRRRTSCSSPWAAVRSRNACCRQCTFAPPPGRCRRCTPSCRARRAFSRDLSCSPPDACLLCNSSFALACGTSNERWRTVSRECPPTSNLFGALGVRRPLQALRARHRTERPPLPVPFMAVCGAIPRRVQFWAHLRMT